MRFYTLGLCLVSALSACDAKSAVSTKSPSGDLADVKAYFAVKAGYDREGRKRRASVDSAYYKDAVAALGQRLRGIIKPDSISDTTLVANIGSLYEGDEDWGALDGLTARRDHGRVLVTTPELLRAWARLRGDSTSLGTAALQTEDMLTWALQDGFHVYPFGDVKAHTSLPKEVFLAWEIGEGN